MGFWPFYYRAMHTVQRAVIAIVSRPSISPSVMLMYRGRIGWTSTKLIIRIISLGLRSSETQYLQSSPRETPLKFGWNGGGFALLGKPAISLKRGKIKVTIDDQ